MKNNHWKQFAAAIGASLLMFSSGLVTNTTTYFVAPVTGEYLWSRAVFFSYYSIIFVATVLVSPFIGYLMPKLGYRKGFLLGTVGVSAGYWILHQLNGLPMLYTGAVLIGIFQPFVIVPPVALVNTWFPDKNGFVMGFVMAGSGAAGIAAAQAIPRIIEAVGWRMGYLFCGGMWALCTLAANFLVGDTPAPGVDASKQNGASPDHKSRYLTAGFLAFLFCCFMKHVASTFTQHLSTCLSDYYSTERLITIMTIYNIVLVLAKMTVGVVYDKLGSKFVVLVLIPMGALGYLWVASPNFWMTVLSTSLLAVNFCAETVVFPLLLRELYDRDFASVAWGVCRSAALTGNAVGAPIWGAIFDHTGSYQLGLHIAPVIVVLICLYHSYRIGKAKQ